MPITTSQSLRSLYTKTFGKGKRNLKVKSGKQARPKKKR